MFKPETRINTGFLGAACPSDAVPCPSAALPEPFSLTDLDEELSPDEEALDDEFGALDELEDSDLLSELPSDSALDELSF